LKINSILMLFLAVVISGCAHREARELPDRLLTRGVSDVSQAPSSGFDEFTRRESFEDFSHSAFVVNDFVNVVVRVPDFVAHCRVRAMVKFYSKPCVSKVLALYWERRRMCPLCDIPLRCLQRNHPTFIPFLSAWAA